MSSVTLLVKLKEVWKEINEHPYAVYFRGSTSENDQHVDLSFIKTTLDNHGYSDLNDFVDHIMTLFDNARKINIADNSLCIAATTLERLFFDALARRELLPSKTKKIKYIEDECGVPLFTNLILEEEELDNELIEIEEQIFRIEEHKNNLNPMSPPSPHFSPLFYLPDDSLFGDVEPDIRLPSLLDYSEKINRSNKLYSSNKSNDEESNASCPSSPEAVPQTPKKQRKIAIKCAGQVIYPPKEEEEEDSINIVYSITQIGETSKPNESCTLEEFEFDIQSSNPKLKKRLEKYIDKCISDAKKSTPTKRSRSTTSNKSNTSSKRRKNKKVKFVHNSPISYPGEEILHISKEVHEDIEVDIIG